MIFENKNELENYKAEHGWNDNKCKLCGAEIPAGLEVCPETEKQYKGVKA